MDPNGNTDLQYGSAAPIHGTGSDGAAYVVTTTGSATALTTTAGGQLTYGFTSSSLHITVTRNGADFVGGSLDAPQQYAYTYTAGKTMTWTQKLSNYKEVIIWTPA